MKDDAYFMKEAIKEAKKALFSLKNAKKKIADCCNLLFYWYYFLAFFSSLRIVMKC